MKQSINFSSLFLSSTQTYYQYLSLQQGTFIYVTMVYKKDCQSVYKKGVITFGKMGSILYKNETWIGINCKVLKVLTFRESLCIYLYLCLRTYLPLICMLSTKFLITQRTIILYR